MPTYKFQCPDCKRELSVFRKSFDATAPECSYCGKQTVRQYEQPEVLPRREEDCFHGQGEFDVGKYEKKMGYEPSKFLPRWEKDAEEIARDKAEHKKQITEMWRRARGR